jgi:hypothetical protein
MSALRSVIDEFCGEDLASVLDRQLEDDVVEIRRALDVLEGQFLRRVAEVDRRRIFQVDGLLSTVSWLAENCRMASSTAAEKVKVAGALEAMPLTAGALDSGDLSYSQARVLVTASQAYPDQYSEQESTLVGLADGRTVADLRTTVDYWRQSLDWQAAVEDAEAARKLRRLHVSKVIGGMVRIEGRLDQESGEVVMTALEAVTTPSARSAGRAGKEDGEEVPSADQRRADGLTEICRQWLDRGQADVAGERPHVSLVVDLDTLERRIGKVCELDQSGTVNSELARRFVCDAGIARVVVDGPSEPLDVGRRTRTIPPSIRRALIVRDRHCQFPACDRPAAWCDGHHLRHWIDGGETKLANLILLCRRHHRLVHEGGFGVEVRDGQVVFTRPDRSEINRSGRPPPN